MTSVAAQPRTKNAYTLGGFARFCKELRVEGGAPMGLEPFQREMLVDHFAGVTETVIVIPKKNGKTTLLAALALFHLENWPDADCVIGASSRDQARILFRQAAGLVRRSHMEGRFDVKGGYGEVRLPGVKDGPRIRVMAADASTGDGVIPSLALVDELHRHPSGDLYGVFRDGLGPRAGQMITISTAGSNLNSPLGLLRAQAHQLPSFTRDEKAKRNYATSDDFVLHEWCLTDSDDEHDLETVAVANPASWQTVDALRRRHDSPSMTPWQWLRFACGIWTEGEEPWISPAVWDDLAEPGLALDPAAPAVMGVDVGVRHDSTGVIVAQVAGESLLVKSWIMASPGGRDSADSVKLELVEDLIRRLCGELTIEHVVYDPWSFRRSAELLEADGISTVEFPQSAERMASASANLYRLVESGQLVHSGDPGLRAHVLAGVTKETERGWRLAKDPKMKRPIDALVALAMAAMVALAPSETAPDPWVSFS